MMSLILQGLYTIAAKAIIFIPLWAVCEQEFMVHSIGNVIYMVGRAAYMAQIAYKSNTKNQYPSSPK